MITNLPSYEDFEKVSKECLIQAFDLFFRIYNNYRDYDDTNMYEEVPLDEVWQYNQGALRTSIILLHQGIETYMKAIIVRASPFLLLEQKRSDWPTLPGSIDKDYDIMFTIAGENLLRTFCSVSYNKTLTSEIVTFIEDVRQKRNRAIHGAGNVLGHPNAIIQDILMAYTYFFGKNQWFNDLKNWNYNNPLFGYIDWDLESVKLHKYLDFLDVTIGLNKLKQFLSFDISGRRYFCPICADKINSKNEILKSKWAFLQPNQPNSKKIHCVNCGFDSEIKRSSCSIKNCKGNVIDINNVCLTCYKPQHL